MPIVAVLGCKGGVGTSLLATNLGSVLGRGRSTILLDLNGLGASDDLYLNLKAERGWQDLLPVAGELSADHIARVVRWHSPGLGLLASTGAVLHQDGGDLISLLNGLRRHAFWVLLDVDSRSPALLEMVRDTADLALIVATPDPPALRAAQRLRNCLLDASVELGLVINQMAVHHPGEPGAIAGSLKLDLAGCVWRDPRAAAHQVNLGELPEPASERGLATAIQQLSLWVESRTEDVAEAKLEAGW